MLLITQIPQHTLYQFNHVSSASCICKHNTDLFCKTISLQQLHKHSAPSFIIENITSVSQLPLHSKKLIMHTQFGNLLWTHKYNVTREQLNKCMKGGNT